MFEFLKKKLSKNSLNKNNSILMVCFDMDNTLCDSTIAESESEAKMIESLCEDIIKFKKHHKGIILKNYTPFLLIKLFNEIKSKHIHIDLEPNGYSRALWIRELLEEISDDKKISKINISLFKNIIPEKYEKFFWEEFNKVVTLYPNALSTLEQLKSSGMLLAMITDSDGKNGIKTDRINRMGLKKYFDYIIITDDTGMNKPALENWNKLLELSNLKPTNCVMVGDIPNVDLINAKKLGFTTVWTKEGFKNGMRHKYVDYEINDIKEILDIIDIK